MPIACLAALSCVQPGNQITNQPVAQPTAAYAVRISFTILAFCCRHIRIAYFDLNNFLLFWVNYLFELKL